MNLARDVNISSFLDEVATTRGTANDSCTGFRAELIQAHHNPVQMIDADISVPG